MHPTYTSKYFLAHNAKTETTCILRPVFDGEPSDGFHEILTWGADGDAYTTGLVYSRAVLFVASDWTLRPYELPTTKAAPDEPAGTYVPAPCSWSHPFFLLHRQDRGFRTLQRAQAYARTLPGHTHEIRSCADRVDGRRYSGAGKDSPFYS